MSDDSQTGQNAVGADDPRNRVSRGVATVFVWNLGQAVLGFATVSVGIGQVLLFGFGAVELVYVVPLAIIAARRGRREMMKGIIIAGCIGVLLTASCWGVLFAVMRGY